VVLLAGAGGGAYYLMTREDSADSTTTSQASESTVEHHSDDESKPHSHTIADVTADGESVKCMFTYAGPSGDADAIMYSDGAGNSRIDMVNVTGQGNKSTMSQIIKGNKSYSIIEAEGQKIGYSFDLDQLSGTPTSGTTSNQGLSPDQEFSMTCEDWDADSAVFEIGEDVQFITLPTLPS
jgi:hypothetical protein